MPDDTPLKTFPKLAEVMRRRGITSRSAPSEWGSYERVRRWVLPFGHPDRRVPAESEMRMIVDWAEGLLCAADFYPADLAEPEGLRLARAH